MRNQGTGRASLTIKRQRYSYRTYSGCGFRRSTSGGVRKPHPVLPGPGLSSPARRSRSPRRPTRSPVPRRTVSPGFRSRRPADSAGAYWRWLAPSWWCRCRGGRVGHPIHRSTCHHEKQRRHGVAEDGHRRHLRGLSRKVRLGARTAEAALNLSKASAARLTFCVKEVGDANL